MLLACRQYWKQGQNKTEQRTDGIFTCYTKQLIRSIISLTFVLISSFLKISFMIICLLELQMLMSTFISRGTKRIIQKYVQLLLEWYRYLVKVAALLTLMRSVIKFTEMSSSKEVKSSELDLIEVSSFS